MKFLGAEWTPRVNMVLIQCCVTFRHRANRVWVQCPVCKERESILRMREEELLRALR